VTCEGTERGSILNHIEHVQAIAAQLEKMPQNRNAAVLEAARRDLSRMNDEEIQSVMNLVQPQQANVSAVGNVIAVRVDDQHLRRAVGVAVAMAGERTLDRVMEIYAREHNMMVSEPLLRDLVEIPVSWFFDVLWKWANEKHPRQSTAMRLLREVPNGSAYAAGQILKLWGAAITTEDKLAVLRKMSEVGAQEFLPVVTACLDIPALMLQALYVISANHYKFWTVQSNADELNKKAQLGIKILTIHRTATDPKIKDVAKDTYFKMMTHEANYRNAFLNSVKLSLERPDTAEFFRVFFLSILGQMYGTTGLNAEQKAVVKKLVDDATKDSREAVRTEAQSSMARIQKADNPPKQEAAKDWRDNF
jgi:hypothetical protein